MNDTNDQILNKMSKPCPPNCDPVEWDRLLKDNACQMIEEERSRLYQQALDQGAEPFVDTAMDPCPPNCDPAEWERAQRDGAMFAHERHITDTINRVGQASVAPEDEDTWPMDMREAEQTQGSDVWLRRPSPR